MLNKGEGMCVFIIYGLRQTQVVVVVGGGGSWFGSR